MELHDHVPAYDVRLAEHLAIGVTHWTPMQRDGFIKEATALGNNTLTRNIRHTGGNVVWTVIGDYHMTYTADPDTKVITITAARPCKHTKKCAQVMT